MKKKTTAKSQVTKQENAMGAPSNSTKATALHEELGVTPEQVDKDLRERGIDPDMQVQSLRRMGRIIAAQFAPQVQREEIQLSPMSKAFPLFEESVAAGSPAWASASPSQGKASIADIIGYSDPDTTMWVRVSGWSMRDEGIKDGDLVLVDTKREARDGDIVVAHIAGEGQVVKRISMLRGEPVVLISANPDFEPRVIDDATSLRIHGVVVGRVGKV